MFKSVLKPEDFGSHIVNYVARAISHKVPTQALPFLKDQREASGLQFTISQMTAESTGLSELEAKNFQDKVETAVLLKLKEVEEKAYSEAYVLGLADGEKKAFSDASEEINQSLSRLREIGDGITQVKTDLVVKNEGHLIKTAFHIAKALALKEIGADPASVVEVLRKAVEGAQADEEITVRLHPVDQEFLEKVKNSSGHPLERIQKVRIEVSENIARGGCIVETNYGIIDATVEQRVLKLWDVLDSKIPKILEGA